MRQNYSSWRDNPDKIIGFFYFDKYEIDVKKEYVKGIKFSPSSNLVVPIEISPKQGDACFSTFL
jgi:hypothetical protein